MLKVSKIPSPESAEQYFTRSRALAPRETEGRWIGGVARALGIQGSPVTPQGLYHALSGWVPDGPHKGLRLRRPHRHQDPGAAVVFTLDKSVSVASLQEEDAKAAALAREAVHRAALTTVEAWETFFVRSGSRPTPTGSLLGAVFSHESSRYSDPHYHLHWLVANTTWDSGTRRLWGTNFRPLWQGVKAMDRVFQAELVRELQARGLDAGLRSRGALTAAVVRGIDRARLPPLSQGRSMIRSRISQEPPPPGMNAGRWSKILGDRHRPRKPPTLDFSQRLQGLRPGRTGPLPLQSPGFHAVSERLRHDLVTPLKTPHAKMASLGKYAERYAGARLAAGCIAGESWRSPYWESAFVTQHRIFGLQISGREADIKARRYRINLVKRQAEKVLPEMQKRAFHTG